jgi:hypothetical protein
MINYVVKITDVPVENIHHENFAGLTETEMLNNLLSGKKMGGGLGTNVMNPQGKLHYIGHSEVRFRSITSFKFCH